MWRCNVIDFCVPGKASVLIGGQWGSEAKGCAAAWLAYNCPDFDIYTTNAGAQAGHTSTHQGKTRVVFHLPTTPLVARDLGRAGATIYLNSGAIIDPEGLYDEMHKEYIREAELDNIFKFYIHPMAAIITKDCKEAEMAKYSKQTEISSTRKGVGESLANKILRKSRLAGRYYSLGGFSAPFIRRLDLNQQLQAGRSVMVEVPQGVSLSLSHSGFYPYVTSRDCTVTDGLAAAGIHPSFLGKTMMVLRTFPIRVGNLEGYTSGPCYPDQEEIQWSDIEVEPEITTVTKRVRRVFTFSKLQIVDSFRLCRPDYVFLSFCNYVKTQQDLDRIIASIYDAAEIVGIYYPHIIFQYGPDVTQTSECVYKVGG
jgi:adenylosuccinate synthase